MRNLKLKIANLEDDLRALAEQINQSSWCTENDVDNYSKESLETYLKKEDTIFIACYLEEAGEQVLAGISSGRIEQKPYNCEKWLYIDEVDACSNHRRKGAGTAMINAMLKLAKDNDCEEVWLAAESDNHEARKFYESLDPHEIDEVVSYTFELE